ncbi:MAG: hypothetical protein IIC67_10380, partial [Thaumarchaeota archaeon]|nr:hypothetical protein [Nitrososphaerota archaeon]
SIMDFNSFNDDYIERNPNDFSYQSEPNPLVENLKFNVQTAIDNLAMNVQTAIDNISENVRTAYENYKQNIQTVNDPYGNVNPNSQINLSSQAEPLINLSSQAEPLINLSSQAEPLINLSSQAEPLINLYDNVNPNSQIDLKQTMNKISIIHEELAEKESRIRHLESERLKDRKKINQLDKEVKKMKNNPTLKWLERATEDSKKERVI